MPVYVFTGWEDMYSRGDLRLIDGLASKHKLLSIDAAPITAPGRPVRSARRTPARPGSQQGVALSAAPRRRGQAWLHRFVQGEHNGIEKKPRVRYFDLGDRAGARRRRGGRSNSR